MDLGDDPYALLGVDPKADYTTIKKSYRKLALRQHPDKGGDPVVFAKIANAYEIISDPQQRHNYDLQQSHGGSKGYDPQAPEFTSTSEDYDPSKEPSRSSVPSATTQSGPSVVWTTSSPSTSQPEWTTNYTTTTTTTGGGTPGSSTRTTRTYSKPVTSRRTTTTRQFQDPMEIFRQHFPEAAQHHAAKTSTSTSVSPNGQKMTTTTTTMTTPDGRTMTMTSSSSSNTTDPTKLKKKPKKPKNIKPKTKDSSSSSSIPRQTKTVEIPTQRMNRISLQERGGRTGGGNGGGEDGNVMSMAQSSRTVTLPNGQKQLITETVITRMDGSTETRRESKMIR